MFKKLLPGNSLKAFKFRAEIGNDKKIGLVKAELPIIAYYAENKGSPWWYSPFFISRSVYEGEKMYLYHWFLKKDLRDIRFFILNDQGQPVKCKPNNWCIGKFNVVINEAVIETATIGFESLEIKEL